MKTQTDVKGRLKDLENRVSLIEKTIAEFLALGMAVNQETLSKLEQANSSFQAVLAQMQKVEQVIEDYQASTTICDGSV